MLKRCWDFQNNLKEHFVFLNILRQSRNLKWFLQCLRWTKQQQQESFEHNSEHGGVYIDINITFCHLLLFSFSFCCLFSSFLLPFFVNWHRASWLLEKGIGGKRTLIPTYWECITFIIASSTHIQLLFVHCPFVVHSEMAESNQMPTRLSPEICHSWSHVFVVRGQIKHLPLRRFHKKLSCTKDFASLVPYMIKWNEILNTRLFFTGLGRISPIVPFCFFLCYTLWSSYSTVACSEDRVRKTACKVQIHDLALFYVWLRSRIKK